VGQPPRCVARPAGARANVAAPPPGASGSGAGRKPFLEDVAIVGCHFYKDITPYAEAVVVVLEQVAEDYGLEVGTDQLKALDLGLRNDGEPH
jgi:hypothetical protein